jgi:multidrug transporter EmrE-like cation transporter
MRNFLYIIIAVIVAVSANSISAIWAKQESKFSIWLVAVIAISPLVFITYGLVTSRIGVALASSVIDSLLIVGTIAVGLVLFKEWDKILSLQYVGIALAIFGVSLILFSPYFTR